MGTDPEGGDWEIGDGDWGQTPRGEIGRLGTDPEREAEVERTERAEVGRTERAKVGKTERREPTRSADPLN